MIANVFGIQDTTSERHRHVQTTQFAELDGNFATFIWFLGNNFDPSSSSIEIFTCYSKFASLERD